MIDADDLPEGWALATLGEVTDPKIRQGAPFDASVEFTYIDITAVDNVLKTIVEPKTLPVKDAPSRARQHVRPGDVLVSMTRPNLNAVAVLPERLEGSIASTGFHVLRPKEVLPEWLFMVVRSTAFVASMSELVQGALYPAVRPSDIRDFTFPVPPLAEQRRIVAKIEELTARSRAARAALAEVPTLLEQFRQSVLALAFRGDLTAAWREKHPDAEPASVLLERIRTERRKQWEAKYPKKKYVEPEPVDDTELPELPEGWCWTCVDEITSLITSGSRDWSQYYDRGTGTFIMAQNVRPGRLDFSEVRQFVDPPVDNRDRERSQVHPGDLLITIVGANTGDLCPVTEELPEHFVCQSVALLRLVETEVQQFVLRYFLRGSQGRKSLEEVIYGQGRPHLGFDDLKVMAVPLAPIAEQREMLQIVCGHEVTIDHVLEQAQRCLSDLAVLDQSLLAKAFRGELVPQVSTDEPASVMLERVRSGGTAIPTSTRSVERGRAKFYILLLLRTWKKQLGREMLERGLLLMLNADVRRAILGRSKSNDKRAKKPKTSPQFVRGMDALLGEMLDDGQLVPGSEEVFFAEGEQGMNLDAAPKDDLVAVQETAEAMKVIHKDKQQATDADIVSALHGEIYELVP